MFVDIGGTTMQGTEVASPELFFREGDLQIVKQRFHLKPVKLSLYQKFQRVFKRG